MDHLLAGFGLKATPVWKITPNEIKLLRNFSNGFRINNQAKQSTVHSSRTPHLQEFQSFHLPTIAISSSNPNLPPLQRRSFLLVRNRNALGLSLAWVSCERDTNGSPSTTSSSSFPQQKFTPTWFGPIIVLVLTKVVAVQNRQRKRALSTMLMLMMLVPVQTRKLECRDPTNWLEELKWTALRLLHCKIGQKLQIISS